VRETDGNAETDGYADWEALLDIDSSELRETEGITDMDANPDCVP
jgi:hypothetical protein